MIGRLDNFILRICTRIADAFQQWTGRTNYTIAAAAFMVQAYFQHVHPMPPGQNKVSEFIKGLQRRQLTPVRTTQ